MIYFIKADKSIKIVSTGDFDRIFNSIQSNCPNKIELIKAVRGDEIYDEFKAKFSKEHTKFDWFKKTKAMLKWIDALEDRIKSNPRTYTPINLSDRAKMIITGTILGGSSLVNLHSCPYLSMRSTDLAWLDFKNAELQQISSNSLLKDGNTYRWHSISHPCLMPFADGLYEGKTRKLELRFLERIWDVTLAVWFADCGQINKDEVILNTHIWGEEGSQIIQQYFGLACYDAILFKERNNFRVRLTKESSENFLRLVKPHLAPFFSGLHNR